MKCLTCVMLTYGMSLDEVVAIRTGSTVALAARPNFFDMEDL